MDTTQGANFEGESLGEIALVMSSSLIPQLSSFWSDGWKTRKEIKVQK